MVKLYKGEYCIEGTVDEIKEIMAEKDDTSYLSETHTSNIIKATTKRKLYLRMTKGEVTTMLGKIAKLMKTGKTVSTAQLDCGVAASWLDAGNRRLRLSKMLGRKI